MALTHPQLGEIRIATAKQQEVRKWYVHPVDENGRIGVSLFGPFSSRKKAMDFIQTHGSKLA